MDIHNIKTEKKFSLAMLLMTIVMTIGRSSFVVSGINATVFAINYRRGLAPRGFFGWILDCICFWFGDSLYCYNTVLVISTIGYLLYLAALWFVAKRFIRSYDGNTHAMAFVIATMFIEMFTTIENYGRSDMYLLILSLIASYAVIKGRGVFLCVLCPVIAIFIHEGYVLNYFGIVIACLIYKIVYSETKKRKLYIIYLIASVISSASAFIWTYFLSRSYLPMSEEIYNSMVSDAELLVAPNGYVHHNALKAYVLGIDSYSAESEYMLTTRLGALFFLILFSPVLRLIWQVIKRIYKESGHKKMFIVFCVGTLSFIPLFVRKSDYGRWIFALFFYIFGLICMLVIADNKIVKRALMERIEEIARSRWEAVFYSVYFVLFMPFYTYYINNICANITILIDNAFI